MIRTLGRDGIPAFSNAPLGDMAAHSRWYRAWPEPLTPATLADRLALSPAGAVLLPCSDEFTLAVAELPDALRRRFPAAVGDAATVRALVDKGALAGLLDAADVPHPRTWLLRTGEEFAAVPDVVWDGAFLKPRDSQSFMALTKLKGIMVRSPEEAAATFATLGGRPMLLQEYVPGPPTNHVFVDGFVDRAGGIAGLMARRRLRMWPPDFGNSTYTESVPLADVAEAAAAVLRLLAHVRWRGAFSAELKRDARDGRYRLLEVNVRPWWYVEFAARCGMDVPRMMVEDAVERPLPPAGPYQAGRSLVFPSQDWPVAAALFRAGELSLGSWAEDWLTSDQAVLVRDDPGPWLSEIRRFAARALRRRLSRQSS